MATIGQWQDRSGAGEGCNESEWSKFDRDSVDNEQLRKLSDEAAAHGDLEMVRLVEQAFEGDVDAAEMAD